MCAEADPNNLNFVVFLLVNTQVKMTCHSYYIHTPVLKVIFLGIDPNRNRSTYSNKSLIHILESLEVQSNNFDLFVNTFPP